MGAFCFITCHLARNLNAFTEMAKFTFAVVAAMIILLAAELHAADNMEVAWQKYLVNFVQYFQFNVYIA